MKRTSIVFQAALWALGLGSIPAAQAAFVPITLTGFNQDVVANGSGTSVSSTTYDVDGSGGNGYTFMAPNFVNPAGASPTSFLPATGVVNSAVTSGLSFQLASYSANNSLRLPLTGSGTTGTGTLALGTPQSAGEVFLLVTSGGGISTVTVTVNFTDATTQVFTGLTVADWYNGTNPVVQGLGRVSRDAASTIDNNTTNPRLYQLRLALAAGNFSKQIQSIAFNKTSTTGVLNVMGASISTLCSGTPNGGTATASATTVCAASSITLSLTGATSDIGISYQWQRSTDNGASWADIMGATSATYVATGITTNTQFRARLTCSGVSANSAPVSITTTAPTYAALPVTESFEAAWVSLCDTRDVPNASWRNAPVTGNNSWRREDDGAAAAWGNVASYLYSPTGSQGTHSARFHSGFATRGLVGTLDLFVNLSAAGAKRLTFDFINTSGTDSLYVQLSNDGGLTFSPVIGLGLSGTVAAGFSNQVLPINSTSTTAVLRFRAKADFGSTDIGLDNVILESATGCLTPAGLTATTTPTTASLSWLTSGTGTYTVVYGPTGFNPATGGTTVAGLAGPPYAVTGLTPGTTYQFYVTQNCAGGNSGTAGPSSFSTGLVAPANDDCAGALNVPIQYGTTCISQVSANNTAATGSTGVPAPGCASYVDQDLWFKVTVPASGEVTVQTLTPTGGSNVTDTGLAIYSGTCGTLALVECDDDDSPSGLFSLITLTGRTPGEVLYIRAWEYGGDTDGLIAVCATSPSNCPVPTGPAAANLTNTTAQLNWTATPAAGNTFEIEYGVQGFTPGTGTTILGLTGTSHQLTGLTANTGYCFYVRQNCGASNGSSAYVGPTCFTTPLTAPGNDEPCGAVVLGNSPVSGTNSGASTSLQNGINLPACSPSQVPKDVWYTIVPSGNSTTLTLTGTASGMVRVFESPDCANGLFNQVFCQSSGSNNTTVGVVNVTGLTPGARYYVAVSGYGSGDTPGTFTIVGTSLLASRAQAETNALLVYPNPSNTGQLTLRLNSSNGNGQASLLNALGQVVLTKALAVGTAEQTLSTRGLAAGLYTLRVKIGQEVLTRKVVLE
jgi:hypothetical protein